MQIDGFNRIAVIYDSLARIVFGNTIRDAQVCFLNDVPPQSKVLILGGGTGWLLARVLELKPTCEVWYIEASEKMLELSIKKAKHLDCVHFILGTEDSIPDDIPFDVVITNFYFDLFTNESLGFVAIKIQNKIKSDALWLVTDFIQGEKWWQFVLLEVMYRFFRLICNIDAVTLPDWNQRLSEMSLLKKKSRLFYNGFIESAVYSRNLPGL